LSCSIRRAAEADIRSTVRQPIVQGRRPQGIGRNASELYETIAVGLVAGKAAAIRETLLHTYRFGPQVTTEGVTFRLWAPECRSVSIRIDDDAPRPMQADEDGWFTLVSSAARHGSHYKFILDTGLEVPDPASRYQPEDVHGPSEIVDGTLFRWETHDWSGRPWQETVIYELHVGTFTREGTFLAAIDRLDYLRDLGVTAIQLMPIGDFPGRYGWGYDGVLAYAPESSYGRPEELKALVDSAHARGLSVFLDVVYNHFGPEGNYLPNYAPLYAEQHRTPWGPAVNFDGEGARPVREFVMENALYWMVEFRFDGLRLDAVHAIRDDSGHHILHELAERVRAATAGRHVHLIVENEDNASHLLERDGEGGPKLYTAQWNDDIHHGLHRIATGEDFGYYADYAGDAPLSRALSQGFAFQGQLMPYRKSPRGEPSAHLPPTAFISFIQNHDQVGNRALGDRLHETAPRKALEAIASIYLLMPQIPMLFMGEEWACRARFPFFCDFGSELREKVRAGRQEELSRLPGFDGQSADEIPDPIERETFLSAKLDWETRDDAALLDLYRRQLALRRKHIVPLLTKLTRGGSHEGRDGELSIAWPIEDGRTLRLYANLTARARPVRYRAGAGIISQLGGIDPDARPWTVIWALDRE
jgi:1,4-alpha-glucan branching enzyme/maltooligosyltrehalose trehalohydrolase